MQKSEKHPFLAILAILGQIRAKKRQNATFWPIFKEGGESSLNHVLAHPTSD